MKPTWVMTDEEKKEKREKTIKRKALPPTLPKIKLQVPECYLRSAHSAVVLVLTNLAIV